MAGRLVIIGGRVIDPASGTDAVVDVAVLDDRIAAVGTGLGGAERVIDAAGLVAAPGFIDLHAQDQSILADRMQAFDGVTTTPASGCHACRLLVSAPGGARSGVQLRRLV